MRRAALLLSFVFLLLAAETAGLVHEIGHGLAGVATRSAAERAHPAAWAKPGTLVCDRCFQYAQIAGLMAASVLAFAAPDSRVESARVAAFAWLPAVAPAFRSRDPPAPF